jgi:hypothetical protein
MHRKSTAGRTWLAILFLAVTGGGFAFAGYPGGNGQTPQSAVVLPMSGSSDQLLKIETDWLKDHYHGVRVFSRNTVPTYRWTCDVVTFSIEGSRPMTAYFHVLGVR